MSQLTKMLYMPLPEYVESPFYPRIPTISLELTAKCNLKCPYCNNATLQRPKDTIKWELLEKLVDEAAGGRLDIANLHGAGEPLLWDRLEDAVRLIRSHDAGTASFGTNATLLTGERFRALLNAGLTQIYFSVDTLDPDLYRRTRGGSLDTVIRNIRAAIRIAPKDFHFTIALMNHKDQEMTPEILDHFYVVLGRHANVVLNVVENQFFPGTSADYRVAPIKRDCCGIPSNYLYIAADGRAAVCCLDQNIKHCLGNVQERSIHDIWFDVRNQTTFRNLALGLSPCPDTCVNECSLNMPKSCDGRRYRIGVGLPFDYALTFATILASNDEHIAALNIAEDLQLRDPLHQGLQQLIGHLKALIPQQKA